MAIKRAYDPPSDEDGVRILVDRIWPRGISKAAASIDEWRRDLAPSDELRKWYAHDPTKWHEFRRRYSRELEEGGKFPEIEKLAELARTRNVTLITASKALEISNAAALKALIEELLRD